MKTITIASIFKNSEKYIYNYFNQLDDLVSHKDFSDYKFNFVWLEGNSTDATLSILKSAGETFDKNGIDVVLEKYDTNHASTDGMNPDNPIRWKRIADAWNKCLNNIPECDYTIVVESDLVWDVGVVKNCLESINKEKHHVVYPMLFHSFPDTHRYYDTHGFVKDGDNFNAYVPYYTPSKEDEGDLVKLTLGGGMIVSFYQFQKNAKFGEHDCIMHFEESVNLYMHKGQRIKHSLVDWQERNIEALRRK